MDYENCCRLCLRCLIAAGCKEEYFSMDENVQRMIAECFQIEFAEQETITKACVNCYNDLLLVNGIRKRFLDTDAIVKCYYSGFDIDRKSEVLDIEEIILADIDVEAPTAKEEQILSNQDSSEEDESILDEFSNIPSKIGESKLRTAQSTKKAKKRPTKIAAKFTCYICPIDFETLQEFDQHMPSHVGTMAQVCHLCDFQVKTVRHLNRHLQLTHFRKGNRIPCSICEKNGITLEFSSNFILKDHIKRIHEGIVETPEAQFVCSYCGKRFTRGTFLRAHENNVHTKAVILKCNYCTKFTATNRAAMIRHERVHTAEKPFKCDECDAAFTQASQLKTHKQGKHSEERPFSCTLCDARSKSKYALQKHMTLHEKHPNQADMRRRYPRGKRIHNGIGREPVIFNCSYCTKFTAKTRGAVIRHERVHTAEKPYKCDECDSAFSQSTHLKTHKKGKHSEERPFSCNLCDARYKSKCVLQKHMSSHEKGNKTTNPGMNVREESQDLNLALSDM